MKQTWGLKNTKYFQHIFFHSTSVPPSLWQKKADDQICPVCAFYNLGRRRLCSYRRAAFGRPRRLTLSSLLRTAKVLFSSLLVLAFILESDPRKKHYICIYRIDISRRTYLFMIYCLLVLWQVIFEPRLLRKDL